MQTKDLTGKTFGRWFIIGFDHNHWDSKGRNQGTWWKCRCNCGTEKVIRGGSLKNGTSKSCGCLLKDVQRKRLQLPKGVAGFNALYSKYKNRAFERGLLFELSKEKFRKLTQQSCFYCGTTPQQIVKVKGSHFIYNGIDRLDNTIGYLESNVVSCCGLCNKMKMNLNRTDFIGQILKIALNQEYE
uniref:Putative HNH endonuclease n=1 Tax=viral metagenome TaxID=1070528 RepID=A0A6M3J8K4_9ZZZZ